MNPSPSSTATLLKQQALLCLLEQSSQKVGQGVPFRRWSTNGLPLGMHQSSAADKLQGESSEVCRDATGRTEYVLRVDGPSLVRRLSGMEEALGGTSRTCSTALELLQRKFVTVVNNLQSPEISTSPMNLGLLRSRVQVYPQNSTTSKPLRRSWSEGGTRSTSNVGFFPLPPLRKAKKARSVSLKSYKSLWANPKLNSMSSRREFFARHLTKGNACISDRSRRLRIIDAALTAACNDTISRKRFP